MKKALVIDGNSILNRAFYGIRPLSTKDGLFTNALYGFVNILLGQLDSVKPDYAAVAFDLPAPTFRHKAYAEYKAGRHKMPDELAMQLPYAHECARLLGFEVIEIEGYEADDILGSLAAAADDDTHTYILTGDRDSLQLINDKTSVLLCTNADTLLFSRQQFFDKYGVMPEQYVDVKALMGDSSDNIPGVAGIGEKTAFKLISQFGTLDALYENLESAECGPSAKRKLAEGKDSAYNSRFLAKINTAVPLDGYDTAYEGFVKDELYSLFTKLEFGTFIKRLKLEESISENSEKSSGECINCDADALSALARVALCFKDNVLSVYDGENIYRYDGDISLLKDFFEDTDRLFALSDLKAIRHYLKKFGIDFASPSQCAHIYDVTLAAYVSDPSDNSYDIERLTLKYLGESTGCECESIFRLSEVLNAKLTEEKQDKLLCEIEIPLASILCDMEDAGFKVDTEGLKKFGEVLGDTAEKLSHEIYEECGEVFNINSPKQLGEVLFEKMMLPAPKKTKTGYSTAADVLNSLKPYYPIVEKILEYRHVVKLKSTYADGLTAVADEKGRVHTTFNQTVTATGRLSSTEPNLQNIPIRTPLGREFRRYFVAENSDYVLIDADYSQIELRLLACVSGDETMIDAFLSGVDIHTSTASQVFGVPKEEVTSELRKRAKAVNFGIVYGIGDFSLANDIGVSRREAGQYIESYLAKYPLVESYLDDIKRFARENGYVTTLFGRRRYIPELHSPKATLRAFGERVAMNSPIQGSAADIIKLAMINVRRALDESGLDARLIMQVHDELIVEASRDSAEKAAEILKREMENAVSLAVPMSVDLNIGDSWFN